MRVSQVTSLQESMRRAREQQAANFLNAPSLREIQTFGMTPDQKEEWEREYEAACKRAEERVAAELREEGEMWLSIYAPDQVYDPAIHYKPVEQSEECDW